jgi:uncharacterized protein
VTGSGRKPQRRAAHTVGPAGRQRVWSRWRRLGLIALALILILAAVTVGFAWYVTSRLIAVTRVQDSYPLRVIAVSADRTIVTLSSGPDAAEPGTFRLAWPGGRAFVGRVTGSGPGFVTRSLLDINGRLSPGQPVGIEPDPYTGDPATALGIPYATVRVPTPLGGMPAWQIAGRRSTWVILIHGLGGSRADTLPVMPALRALGFPMLAITYRNDAGAPSSPDHQSHLGATEWRDVAAAVRYATGHGARGVVLFGYSLGGAMAMVTAADASVHGQIRALILDSPILDWQATLTYQGHRHHLPAPLISLTETLLAWRTGLSYARFDQLRPGVPLRVPVLLIQGTADTIVPPALADMFARSHPHLVTYLRVPGADHVSAIDTDPIGYRAALTQFLDRYP